MLVTLAIALLALPGTITVGTGGTHATIQEAIDAASPGDVLSLAPGSYSGFTLTKSLTIAASSGVVTVTGSTTVSGSFDFILSGLDFVNSPGDFSTVLLISGVSGRGTIDNCQVVSTERNPSTSGLLIDNGNALVIESCGDLVVSRTTAQGYPTGLEIRSGSLVAVVDCTLVGGPDAFSGGAGAQVSGSEAHFAGGSLTGGVATDGTCAATEGGHAIEVADSTVLLARPNLFPGDGGPCFGLIGRCIKDQALGTPSSVTNSAVCTKSIGTTVGEVRLPKLIVTETTVPVVKRTVSLFGPVNEIGVVIVSLDSAQIPLVGTLDYQWVGFGAGLLQLLFYTNQTFTTSANKTFTIPSSDPTLDGVIVHLQAFFPLVPATGATTGTLSTNPSNIIVRPQF